MPLLTLLARNYGRLKSCSEVFLFSLKAHDRHALSRISQSKCVIHHTLFALVRLSLSRYWDGASISLNDSDNYRPPANLSGTFSMSKKHTFAVFSLCTFEVNGAHSSLSGLMQWKCWYLNPGSLSPESVP